MRLPDNWNIDAACKTAEKERGMLLMDGDVPYIIVGPFYSFEHKTHGGLRTIIFSDKVSQRHEVINFHEFLGLAEKGMDFSEDDVEYAIAYAAFFNGWLRVELRPAEDLCKEEG